MKDFVEIEAVDFKIPATLKWGMLRLSKANKLPLSKVIFDRRSPHEMFFVLWGKTRDPRREFMLFYIQMAKFPHAVKAFQDNVQFFSEEKKKWVRLPGDKRFDPSMLVLPELLPSWNHEAFARSARDFIHLYTRKDCGLLVRFGLSSGDILQCRFFHDVIKNLRVSEFDWSIEIPTLTHKASSAVRERRMTSRVAEEIRSSVSRARTYLGLTSKDAAPQATMNAILSAVDKLILDKRRISASARCDLAVDLGCLWGQTICDALHWKWCEVRYGQQPALYSIASPDRAYVIAPMHYMQRQVEQRRTDADNTVLLLFNMIVANSMPSSPPRSYRMLG